MPVFRKISKILLCIAMPLFIIAVFIFFVQISAGDENWLTHEYEKLHLSRYTGMSTETMTDAFSRLAQFMKGKTDSLDMDVEVHSQIRPMFTDREKSHMADVRNLYSGVMKAEIIFCILAVSAAVMVFISFRRGGLKIIAKTFLYSFAGVYALFFIIALFAAVDFDAFWKIFHMIFLDIESSVFDPAQSLMIRICPLELFRDMTARIFLRSFAVCAVLAAASAICLKTKKRRTLAADNR